MPVLGDNSSPPSAFVATNGKVFYVCDPEYLACELRLVHYTLNPLVLCGDVRGLDNEKPMVPESGSDPLHPHL